MPIRPFNNIVPTLGDNTYIDPQAALIGAVNLGDDCSVWPFTSIRGDVNTIQIGHRTNIQDNSTIHVSHDSDTHPGGAPTVIGQDVTVGHQVILHACQIGDRCLIGMGSIIMDNAIVEHDVMVGAGSLITQDSELLSGYLYVGRPARKVRRLTQAEIDYIPYSALHYVRLKDQYLQHVQ